VKNRIFEKKAMIDSRKVVALLPMKAHSSRVPGKNFRKLAGKPLFRWILDTLLNIEEIDQIIINTDARDILAENGLKESNRVVIRDRKKELCGDEVSMNVVLADDVESVPADIYIMTHTTNPLLGVKTIGTALNKFADEEKRGNCDSLFSVNRMQTRFYREDGSPVNHDPDNLVPTQELEPWFEENSNLYIFTDESFMKTNARIGESPMMYETPRIESVDIDEEEDWIVAEALAKSYAGSI
jgi:CMP-N-acetylneuraminic acid synthetase